MGPFLEGISEAHLNYKSFLGRNVANPTAILLCTVKMLDHLGLEDQAQVIRKAINDVLTEGKVRTRDIGGFATTTQFTQAVINHM